MISWPLHMTLHPLTLPENEVHLWRADLDALRNEQTRLLDLLSSDERYRAASFHFVRDRERYVVARGFLRTLISQYLACLPSEISFRYSTSGKPELDGALTTSHLQFNLSHSSHMAVFAITRGRKVGVDIEHIRADFDTLAVAQRFFSAAEKEALLSVSPKRQAQAFFNCWTRKEAFVKATGKGLAFPLDQFDVSVFPSQATELLATRPDPEERRHWSIWALDITPTFAGALVVEGSGLILRAELDLQPWEAMSSL